jgi:hypothetical protein
MADHSKLTARERLAAAKMTLAAIEKEVDATTEARRRALLADDDDRVAAAIDDERAALLLRRQRCIDKIEWLPARIAAEESEARWPQNLEGAQIRLAELQRLQIALRRKSRFDRSAADDSELDSLVCWIGALKKHIPLHERRVAR